MKLLLDTHFMVWLATDRDMIRPAEWAVIEADATKLIVSALSIWELRLKWRKSPIEAYEQGLLRPDIALGFIELGGIELAALTGKQCAAALKQGVDHKDLFDEMLLVHAQEIGARLLTRDKNLRRHPLALQP